MIIEYHRPDTKEKALDLLARKEPRTVVLGGGLHLNEIDDSPVSVVDLRELGLAGISLKGTSLHMGASVTLQSLLDQEGVPEALASAIRHQETYNRRQVATAAGAIVAGGGRSPVLCLLLALDAGITLLGKGAKQKMIQIGDFLPILEEELRGKMITEITIPAEIHGSYHYSARSPADLPIVAAAAAIFLVARPQTAAPPAPIALATTSATTADPTGVRFKGKPQIAVVRERDGGQARLGIDAGIRAWDRLRVEISVDAPTTLEVGVLSEDGAWVTLLPAKMLTPGTHFSPKAVRFDDAPTAGWIIAGSPEQVEHARQSREFDDVAVVRLHVEKGK